MSCGIDVNRWTGKRKPLSAHCWWQKLKKTKENSLSVLQIYLSHYFGHSVAYIKKVVSLGGGLHSFPR